MQCMRSIRHWQHIHCYRYPFLSWSIFKISEKINHQKQHHSDAIVQIEYLIAGDIEWHTRCEKLCPGREDATILRRRNRDLFEKISTELRWIHVLPYYSFGYRYILRIYIMDWQQSSYNGRCDARQYCWIFHLYHFAYPLDYRLGLDCIPCTTGSCFCKENQWIFGNG